MKNGSLVFVCILICHVLMAQDQWSSSLVKTDGKNKLVYKADGRGNTIPDFSRVGYYHGEKTIPHIETVIKVSPGVDDQANIQQAINLVSTKTMNSAGFRGAVELLPGTYRIPGILKIDSSGVVLRGSGSSTVLIATGTVQRSLVLVGGKGNPIEIKGTRKKVTNVFMPTGSFTIELNDTKNLSVGDEVILQMQANDQWIRALHMDSIVERPGTQQWKAAGYRFQFQRKIMAIDGLTITMDNPLMMELDQQYMESHVYAFQYPGRIKHVGIEKITFVSEFESDTAENHGWIAIQMDKVENSWVREVESQFFGVGCVALKTQAKNITVTNSRCLDAKSIITGGRRYSFSNDGQQNLVMHCYSRDARHDYATGSKVCGPNVFWDCTAENSHSDIGPHHRWASGTLYDNIKTDGQLNVQDRGHLGSGHGWTGVTQVIWNPVAKTIVCQDPWVSGKNYLIGGSYTPLDGFLKGRVKSFNEGNGKTALNPSSLYDAQLRQRLKN